MFTLSTCGCLNCGIWEDDCWVHCVYIVDSPIFVRYMQAWDGIYYTDSCINYDYYIGCIMTLSDYEMAW